jgi:SAM-dependent methyltransferase
MGPRPGNEHSFDGHRHPSCFAWVLPAFRCSPRVCIPVIELGLRNDVYRRPLLTALDRLGLREGWRCVDVGAGGGDVSVALAEVVGRDGRIYAVDRDPETRDLVAEAAAAHTQVVAITQAAEELLLPEPVDLAFCRFLLMHVGDPLFVLERMGQAVREGGWVVAQEPITSAGRVGGRPLSMPDALHPDVGAQLPALVRDAGLQAVDAWAESQAAAGPGPVRDYLANLTGVDPGDDPVVLPPLVTVVARVQTSMVRSRQ